MNLKYLVNAPYSVEQFVAVLEKSTLGERRPVHDLDCMNDMVKNANLSVTAWDGDTLVGIARSVTDFSFCCYIPDLAVDTSYQKMGIGKKLLALTKECLGPRCNIILISAPAAVEYYPHIGFEKNPNTWVLMADKKII